MRAPYLQAAAAMAEAASRNAADPEYESPYTRAALEEGFDIPIWEKLISAKIKVLKKFNTAGFHKCKHCAAAAGHAWTMLFFKCFEFILKVNT